MDENEEFVRASWKGGILHQIDSGPLDGACFKLYPTYVAVGGNWSELAEFTRNRKEEIRRVEAEIKLAEEIIQGLMVDSSSKPIIAGRILRRLEAIRDELKRGML